MRLAPIVQLSRSAGRRLIHRSCLRTREEGAIKFSNTPAFRGRQRSSPNLSIPQRQLKDPSVHIVEFITVGGSLLSFLIYFGFIREENDLDEAMDVRNAPRRLDEIETRLLSEAIARGRAKGQNVGEYEKRLAELTGQS